MKKSQDQHADATELRRRAEERLKRQMPEGRGQSTEVETLRLVHELQVHQIELEMQNEELQQARAQVETLLGEQLQRAHAQVEVLLAQYTDLYDFAPTGYLTLDLDGAIRQVNLTGARLLGVERSRLVNRRFGLFVAEADRRTFSDFLQKVFAGQAKESCEVMLPQEGSQPLVVYIEGTRCADGQECRAAMLDVTDHKRAEEAYRSLVDHSLQGLVIFQDGRIVFANRAMAEITGYTVQEMLEASPEKVQAFVHPEDRELVWRRHEQRLNGEILPERYEIRGIRKDGSVCWLEIQASTIEYQGRPAIQAAYVDITENRKATESLRKSTEQLKTIFEGTVDGIIYADRKGNVFEVNPAFTKITGIPRDQVVGKNAVSLARQFGKPKDLPQLLKAISDGLMGKPVRLNDLEINNRVVEIATSALTKETAGITAVIRDVTDRKTAEKALTESEQRLKILFESAPDGIYLSDLEGNFIDGNRMTEELAGYAREELIGRSFAEAGLLWPNEVPKAIANLGKIAAGEPTRPDEFTLKRKDGTQVVVEIRAYPVSINGQTLALGIACDITQRKKAEHLLRKERDKAQQYLDVAAVIMVAVDSEQRVGLINKKGCEILGDEEQEIIGKNWFDNFLPERVKDEVKAVFEKFVRGQVDAPEYAEHLILTKDGRERLIAWHNTIIKDDQGNFAATLSSGEDITERRQVENRLRWSEEKYRDLFENAREAIITFDTQGNITGANKLIEEYGFRRGQFIGKPLFDFVAEDHRAKAVGDFETLIRGHPVRGEMDVVTPKGVRTVEYSDNPIVRAGKVVGVQAILTDIMDRKKAEAAIRESEERLKILFESAPDAIYLTDLKGCFVDGNKATEELSGFSRSELIGKNIAEAGLLSSDQTPKLVSDLERIAAGEPVGPHEFTLTRKDGSYAVVEVRAYPVRINNQTLAMGIARDITRRKTVEQALKRQTLLSRAFLESMPSVALLLRPQTREIVASNRQAQEVGAVPGTICYGTWTQRQSAYPWCLAPEVWNTGESRHLEVEYEGIVWDAYWVPIEKDLYLHYAFDITERKRAEEKLLEYQAKLKGLASRRMLAEERERRRIAIRLHDSICQDLVMTKVLLQSTLRLASNPSVSGPLKIANEAMSKLIKQLDSLTFELSNPILRELGLVAALKKHLAEDIQGRHGIAFKLTGDEHLNIPDEELKNCLFRITRELLTNVVKHSQARNVKVSIHGNPGRIRIRIQDDGVGFDTTQVRAKTSVKNRFGLFSVREQLEYLGGSFTIEAEPGGGTVATVVVPLVEKACD